MTIDDVAGGGRPLLIARDEMLLDDVLRIAAATGTELDVVPDAVAARGRWSVAPLVLVDAGLAADCVRTAFPRRAGVIVIGRSEPAAAVWQHAVAVGAEQVLAIPDAEAAVVDVLRKGTGPRTRQGPVLACIGGRGGAGASVLAAGLAVTAGKDSPALLFDLDPFGGGLDVALGAQDPGGLRWDDLGRTSGRLSARALRDALPRLGGVAVLAPRRAGAQEIDAGTAAAVIRSSAAAGDTVVLDLPRRLTPAVREGLVIADRVLVVVPAEIRACVAASALICGLAGVSDRLELVVRMVPGSHVPAASIASTLGLPLATVIRTQDGIAAAADHGQLPSRVRGAFGAACRSLLATTAVAAGAVA